jgi:hypothetical protein
MTKVMSCRGNEAVDGELAIMNYVGDSLTPVHRFSAHACMTIKICTTAWL